MDENEDNKDIFGENSGESKPVDPVVAKDDLDDIFGENSEEGKPVAAKDDLDDIFGEKSEESKPVAAKDDLDDIFGEKSEESRPVVARDNLDDLFGEKSEESKPVEAKDDLVEILDEKGSADDDLFGNSKIEIKEEVLPPSKPVDDTNVNKIENDIFDEPAKASDNVAPKEEPTEDQLFGEEISLDDDAESKSTQPSPGNQDLGHSKTKEELLEEESGDTFDINIKLSDPMKVGDGMNAYMAYSVTTTTSISSFKSSEFSVKRRFSDFLGLHERLSEKHTPVGRIVPPPPDKSVVSMVKVKGSKDDQSSTDFVSKRKNALEKFLNRLARHKLLLEDPDFKEFLEAEELPRAKNTSALSKGGLSRLAKGIGEAVSKMTSNMTEEDSWFEDRQSRVDDLDHQVRKLHAATEMLCTLRREVSYNTSAFAKSLSLLSSSEEHTGLSRALSHLAELEEKIEQIQLEQASTDFYLLSETLKEYIGLIASVKVAFAQRVKVWGNWQSAQTTLTKKREALVKLEASGKADKIESAKEEVSEWEGRVKKGEAEFVDISKMIKVEVSGFETMRLKDFKELIIGYLESLLGIEQQFVKLWEEFSPVAKSI